MTDKTSKPLFGGKTNRAKKGEKRAKKATDKVKQAFIGLRLTDAQKQQATQTALNYQPKPISVAELLRLRASIIINDHTVTPSEPVGVLLLDSYKDTGEKGGIGYMFNKITAYTGAGWDDEPKSGQFWVSESDVLKLITTNFK